MLTKNSTINSIKELIQYTNYILDPLNSTYRYRGQANYNWPLQPSIYRFQNLKRYQTTFFEEILIQYKPKFEIPPILNTNYDFEWLMLCQHYDIPTRFLDWTSDVLTSLFFACNENFDKDAALFICNIKDYPTIPTINFNPRDIQDLVFLNSNIINPRMRAQSGSFMIWGHSPLNSDVSKESYDLWEYYNQKKDTKYFIEKLIIPKEKKLNFLNVLEKHYNINYENLYLNNVLNKTVLNTLIKIKYEVLNTTLYITESNKLSTLDKNILKFKLPHIGEDCFANCLNMRSMNLQFKL
jgi:hypothetical protein